MANSDRDFHAQTAEEIEAWNASFIPSLVENVQSTNYPGDTAIGANGTSNPVLNYQNLNDAGQNQFYAQSHSAHNMLTIGNFATQGLRIQQSQEQPPNIQAQQGTQYAPYLSGHPIQMHMHPPAAPIGSQSCPSDQTAVTVQPTNAPCSNQPLRHVVDDVYNPQPSTRQPTPRRLFPQLREETPVGHALRGTQRYIHPGRPCRSGRRRQPVRGSSHSLRNPQPNVNRFPTPMPTGSGPPVSMAGAIQPTRAPGASNPRPRKKPQTDRQKSKEKFSYGMRRTKHLLKKIHVANEEIAHEVFAKIKKVIDKVKGRNKNNAQPQLPAVPNDEARLDQDVAQLFTINVNQFGRIAPWPVTHRKPKSSAPSTSAPSTSASTRSTQSTSSASSASSTEFFDEATTQFGADVGDLFGQLDDINAKNSQLAIHLEGEIKKFITKVGKQMYPAPPTTSQGSNEPIADNEPTRRNNSS